jgi:hypothetical protein
LTGMIGMIWRIEWVKQPEREGFLQNPPELIGCSLRESEFSCSTPFIIL